MKTHQPSPTITQRARQSLLLFTTIGLLGTAPTLVEAATLSEMLEQGVYSEETKGDFDAAVKIYQQVVQEARQGEAIAAQAQYRLGMCYYKQRKFPEATAAFETLVKDYPNQKHLVRLASEYLAGAVALLPAPWTDGEQMRLTIKTSTGYELGFVRYTVHSDEVNGQRIWRVGTRLVAGPKQASVVEVDADTFKPLRGTWKHTLLGEASTTYTAGRAEVKLAGKDEPITTDLEGVCYDNEEVIQLVRRLPLSLDYRTTLRVFTSLGGANIIPIEFKVTGQETITVPAGTFDCYRIELSLVNQTFWYATDPHRYLVRFDASGISAELTGVEQLTAPELKARMEADLDLSMQDSGGGVP